MSHSVTQHSSVTIMASRRSTSPQQSINPMAPAVNLFPVVNMFESAFLSWTFLSCSVLLFLTAGERVPIVIQSQTGVVPDPDFEAPALLADFHFHPTPSNPLRPDAFISPAPPNSEKWSKGVFDDLDGGGTAGGDERTSSKSDMFTSSESGDRGNIESDRDIFCTSYTDTPTPFGSDLPNINSSSNFRLGCISVGNFSTRRNSAYKDLVIFGVGYALNIENMQTLSATWATCINRRFTIGFIYMRTISRGLNIFGKNRARESGCTGSLRAFKSIQHDRAIQTHDPCFRLSPRQRVEEWVCIGKMSCIDLNALTVFRYTCEVGSRACRRGAGNCCWKRTRFRFVVLIDVNAGIEERDDSDPRRQNYVIGR